MANRTPPLKTKRKDKMKATIIYTYKKISIAANAINNVTSMCVSLFTIYYVYKHPLQPTIKNVLLGLALYTITGAMINIIVDGQKELKDQK